MLNYDYQNRTRIIFGRDTEDRVGELVRAYSDHVLLVYGGGSIKRSGLYDRVARSLGSSSVKFTELSGIVPNPRISKIREGIACCREHGIRFILAVGGGSVIDTAKTIAAGVPYDGDPWEFFTGVVPKEALPVAAILTIPATGSESSPRAVISNDETKQKLGIGYDILRPVFSILDPSLCSTLPSKQIANAVFDMMSHTMERYFTNTDNTDLIDGLCESMLRTMIKFGPIVLDDPSNYDAWCQLVQAGNLSHNGLMGLGREEDWANHRMEHEMSALYDCDHGAGLAVTTLAWMRYVCARHVPMFAQFAVNVMGIQGSLRDLDSTARAGIDALESFCRRMGLPTRMKELGIDSKDLKLMAERAVGGKDKTVGNFEKLTPSDVVAIYELATE